jgi:soluble lytic murein transglycosylase-like protein
LGRLSAALALAALVSARPAAADPADRWSGDVAEASLRFGIPAEWIRRVIEMESGGRNMADGRPVVSRAGAMGLMQLMPATWRDMRALLGLGPDPYRPHDNIMAGTAYLRLMYDRFGYPGLFAAYNAGPSRYGDYLSGRRPLPPETRAYVLSVAPAMQSNDPRPGRQAGTLFALPESKDATQVGDAAPVPHGGALFVELGSGDGGQGQSGGGGKPAEALEEDEHWRAAERP